MPNYELVINVPIRVRVQHVDTPQQGRALVQRTIIEALQYAGVSCRVGDAVLLESMGIGEKRNV